MPLWLLLGCGVYDIVDRLADTDDGNTSDNNDPDEPDPNNNQAQQQLCDSGIAAFCTCYEAAGFMCDASLEAKLEANCLSANQNYDRTVLECYATYADDVAAQSDQVVPKACIEALNDCFPDKKSDTGLL